MIQPDTLLRRHQELFRFYWWRKSRGHPRISPETIAPIRKMAAKNYSWGAERISGELLNLGMEVSKRTIHKHMPKVRKSRSPSQTWATFLKNQANAVGACNFTVA